MEKHRSSQAPSNDRALLSLRLNSVRDPVKRIHLMGICGTGMASLAGLLSSKGFHITGSDQNVYPPMSDFLESLHIPVLSGYRPENLHPSPDLVIVGNVITRQNPEAVELSRLKLPYLSLPQALGHFAMKGKQSIVISGTHGKTTTSSLASWVLEKAGLDPGFMIGGIPLNFHQNFKSGHGPYFVVEGDEYDTAFFDKGPKFLHYRPWVVILTSIEFDHADIYRDLDHVLASFRKLIDLIPDTGLLIANTDDPRIANELGRAKCPVWTYGLSGQPMWGIREIFFDDGSTHLRIAREGREFSALKTPLYGRHNISNLLSTVALASFLALPQDALSQAVASFKSVKRRQEILGEKRGILVVDDFAHHPTAVCETVRAVKERFSERRLVAVFEPRSNSSRRKVFQERYADSFEAADLVMIPEPPLMQKVPPEERFSSRQLIRDLQKKGIAASYFETTDALLNGLLDQAHAGDITLFMSNGGFDNLPGRFLKSL
jgi:UDP-N-acetylmuramate: L-alanyl-gamma-D-glutamyl-meso-diaminopimelate ligase